MTTIKAVSEGVVFEQKLLKQKKEMNVKVWTPFKGFEWFAVVLRRRPPDLFTH